MADTLHGNNDKYDLVQSPDDGGWYLQRWSDNATSQVFATRQELSKAARAYVREGKNCIQWTMDRASQEAIEKAKLKCWIRNDGNP